MRVFHGAFLQIGRNADVMVRSEDQAGAFAVRKFAGFDLSGEASCSVTRWSRPKTISVSVSARMRSSIGSLCRPDRSADKQRQDIQCVADHHLKANERQMKEFQCSSDALQKHLFRILDRLIVWARPPAEPQSWSRSDYPFRDIAVGLPRVTPGPVDAEAPFSRGVFSGHVKMVVGSA